MKLFSRKKPSSSGLPQRRRLTDAERQERGDFESVPSQYSYRRNQTLTGSRTIASASEKAAQRQSPRIVVHNLRRQRRKIGLWLIGAIVALAVIATLVSQFTATVHVAIYGQVRQAANADEYQHYASAIDTYLSERPLQRFRALLNTEQLRQYFEDNGMREVQLIRQPTANGYGEARFDLKMREPIASWDINGNQNFVDINGVIFSKNFYTVPSVTILDEGNVQATNIRTATSGRFLSFIGQAVGAFSELNSPVSQVVLPIDTTRQVISVLDGYKVKMSVDRPAGEQAEDAVRAVRHLKGQGTQTEYVDVRVSGRAFYR